MKSCIIGQIHDSLILDTSVEELNTVLDKVMKVMTVDVRKAWSWIITPLEVDVEVARKNWFQKTSWKRGQIGWEPKDGDL